jgi:glycogen(starch) synthase
MAKTVCMLVLNAVTDDPRVRREAATLAGAGYRVEVIGLQTTTHGREEWIDGYQITRVAWPNIRTIQDVMRDVRNYRVSLQVAVLSFFKRNCSPVYDRLRKAFRSVVPPCAPAVISCTEPSAHSLDPASQRGSPWERFTNDHRSLRVVFWLNRAMAEEAEKRQADVYHVHDLDTLLAGYWIKRRTGKLLVYDFHEAYTEQYQPGVKTRLWKGCYSFLERALIKRVDASFTVCESLADWAAKRYGTGRAVTVMNVPRRSPTVLVRNDGGRERVILYHGRFVEDRGIEQLVESARYLRRGHMILRGAGHLEGRLRSLVKTHGLEGRVAIEPPVPMAEVVQHAAEADIGVLPYVPSCFNNYVCLPNKLFEYMMAGLAVAGSDLPEIRRIVSGRDIGVLFNAEDPKDIARALNELLDDEAGLEQKRRNAWEVSHTVFNWEEESRKLLRHYDSFCAAPQKPVALVAEGVKAW